jgi:5-formyltetrahydrofolate cyclo-ligase
MGDGAKHALRARLLARRRLLTPADLAAAAHRLTPVVLDEVVVSARTVAAYVSVGTEPGTGPLLEELEQAGVETLLPVLLPDGDLDWARYTGPHGLAPASRGLVEPRARPLGRDAVLRAQVLLVPALAVDRRGYRLGRGGGSYDRVLARLIGSGVDVVALLHDGELLDLPVPREPHDQPVHAVVTPSVHVRLR